MDNSFRDRDILATAQQKGPVATLAAFFRLSGPGWLQSAITLGGGSLGGALYLGMLGGTSMLWLQFVAIVIGVIMLSAISYVTLSTGKHPYAAINEYVNPVLGVGWITATILANMIWILPQFALCFDALEKNLLVGTVADSNFSKAFVSTIIGLLAFVIVAMSFNPGWMSKIFDALLKLVVALVVLCFVAVVLCLFRDGSINWGEVIWGFVPNIQHWNTPANDIQSALSGLIPSIQEYWSGKIVANQQNSMIGVTATAVGLNMTFLLPYSMLSRGWDKPFRGLARFDLIFGMAIPYLIVTTCIVIASAHAFHAKADAQFLSSDPAVVQSSKLFDGTVGILTSRFEKFEYDQARATLEEMHPNERSEALQPFFVDATAESFEQQKDDYAKAFAKAAVHKLKSTDPESAKKQLAIFAAGLSVEERILAVTLLKPDAAMLATSLKPLLGVKNANFVFGMGALAMGFSTIVILMMINGFAVAEIVGHYQSRLWRLVGALAAGIVGFLWWKIWAGESKTWLIILASTFGAILLPIAYVSFFALMNNSKLLGKEKPTGTRLMFWNVLMGVGVLGAVVQAVGGIATKINDPTTGSFVIGGVVTFLILAIVGFSARFRPGNPRESDVG